MSRKNAFKDLRGAHARIYESIFFSYAFQALSSSSRLLYLNMRISLKGHNNGDLSATLSTMKHRGIQSSATLAKGLRELETVGLIAKTVQGGITFGGKHCSLYRFTDEACLSFPAKGVTATKPTNDWERWGSLAEAKRAISEAHRLAKRPDVPNQEIALKVQRLAPTASLAEAPSKSFDSVAERPRAAPLQKAKLRLAC